MFILIFHYQVQASASDDASNVATFEVRTVGVDELSEEDGIMRSLNGADKAAAEDRFCWPPATPSCVSSTRQDWHSTR